MIKMINGKASNGSVSYDMTNRDLLTVSQNNTVKTYHKIRTSMHRGYVSRVGDVCMLNKYTGIYGNGYTVDTANQNSTQYCFRSYYVEG